MNGTFNGVPLRRITSITTETVNDSKRTTIRVLEYPQPELEAHRDSFDDLFNCRTCCHWYPREHEGPYGDCKHCFWGIPIDRKALIPESAIVMMMAREIENLFSV